MWRFLVLGVLCACSGGETPVVHVEVHATCAELQGSGEVRRAGRPYWEPLARGTVLRHGDWVRTAAAASAHLELLAGGRLDLLSSAVVVIEPIVGIEEGEVQATTADDVPLTVRHGKQEPRVLPARSVYRLKAATGAGSGLEVRRVDDGPPPPVVPPAVVVGKNDPGTPRVSARPPSTFPSSVTPGIDARVKFDPRGWVKLTWTPVAGATRYRVQTARDWSFTVETRTIDVEGTSWLMRPDGVGLYVWRVAAVGKNGEAGEFGFARRLFLEEDTPTDLLLAPVDGFTSPGASVVFNWQIAGNNASYRLMVSKGADPQRAPVVNEVTTGAQATAPALPPGTYHWGVYEEGSVLRPLFLKPRKLVVKASAPLMP